MLGYFKSMSVFLCKSAVALMVCSILIADNSIAQSLSIKKIGTGYAIEAGASADSPQTLQASQNFHLWIDVTNDLTAPFASLLEYSHFSSRFYRLIPSLPEAPAVRILSFGDSLTSDISGWAGGMYGYFKPNVTFVNYATPGLTSESALSTGSFERSFMLSIKPDFVFFTYGGTDLNTISPEQYEANLKAIVDFVRGFNGVPFLVTLHADKLFDSEGKFIPTDHAYNPITRRVAAEKDAPLIDLHKLTTELYTKLGADGSRFMIFTGFPNDTVHLSPQGAVWVSQLVAKILPDNFGPYLTEKVFDPPPHP